MALWSRHTYWVCIEYKVLHWYWGPKRGTPDFKSLQILCIFFLSPKKQAVTNKWKQQMQWLTHLGERERDDCRYFEQREASQITLNFIWSLRVGRVHVWHLKAKLPQLLSTLTPLPGGSWQAAGESPLTSSAGLRVQLYHPIWVPSVQKLQLSRVPLNWPQGPGENCSPLFCSQRQGQIFQCCSAPECRHPKWKMAWGPVSLKSKLRGAQAGHILGARGGKWKSQGLRTQACASRTEEYQVSSEGRTRSDLGMTGAHRRMCPSLPSLIISHALYCPRDREMLKASWPLSLKCLYLKRKTEQ